MDESNPEQDPAAEQPAQAEEKTPAGKKREPEKGGITAFVENVEAIIVAIILAVVIRQFVLEAFKIPTPSMSPTLRGRENGKSYGDRVLVNKLMYQVSDPKLWDVVVFKYPYPSVFCRSDPRHKNAPHVPRHRTSCAVCNSSNVLLKKSDFIKRLVGLPGKRLAVRHGDIYLDNTISRKTPAAQEALWMGEDEVDFSETSSLATWIPSGGRPTLEAGLLKISGDADVTFRYNNPHDNRYIKSPRDKRRVFDKYDLDILPLPVGDLRITLNVRARSDSGQLVLLIHEDNTTYIARIPVSGSDLAGSITILEGAVESETLEHNGVLPQDRFVKVSFANVDDTVILTIDGETVRKFPRPNITPPYVRDPGLRWGANPIARGIPEIQMQNLAADVKSIELEKDIYYTNVHSLFNSALSSANGVKIPEGEYFFMGDNSRNSSDSREWGTVARDQIVGKAFMIFWPFQPFHKETRVGLIH